MKHHTKQQTNPTNFPGSKHQTTQLPDRPTTQPTTRPNNETPRQTTHQNTSQPISSSSPPHLCQPQATHSTHPPNKQVNESPPSPQPSSSQSQSTWATHVPCDRQTQKTIPQFQHLHHLCRRPLVALLLCQQHHVVCDISNGDNSQHAVFRGQVLVPPAEAVDQAVHLVGQLLGRRSLVNRVDHLLHLGEGVSRGSLEL